MTLRDKLKKMKVILCGFPYKIKYDTKLIEKFSVAGVTGLFSGEMILDPLVTTDDLISVLLHESIEVMLRKNEITVDHELVTKLENLTFRFLKDNKELVRLLLNNISK